MCIETSARRGIKLGYDVIVVEDGHSTFDFEDIKAVYEIDRVNHELREIARVVKSTAVFSQSTNT